MTRLHPYLITCAGLQYVALATGAAGICLQRPSTEGRYQALRVRALVFSNHFPK